MGSRRRLSAVESTAAPRNVEKTNNNTLFLFCLCFLCVYSTGYVERKDSACKAITAAAACRVVQRSGCCRVYCEGREGGGRCSHPLFLTFATFLFFVFCLLR